MVNLEKWEVVDHKDIRGGDLLKVVWRKRYLHKVVEETYKSRVVALSSQWFTLEDGSGWSSGPAPEGVVCTVYRRKAKAFVFPLNAGSVITGEWVKGGRKVAFVNVGCRIWTSVATATNYTETEIRVAAQNLTVRSEGVSLHSA